MPDFDINDEILRIMEVLDRFPECCRENLLKMTAAWEKDIVQLRQQRDEARESAAELSVYARQCYMDNPRTSFGADAKEHHYKFTVLFKKWNETGWWPGPKDWGEQRGLR